MRSTKLLSNMRVEFYPLWMEANPDLFEKSKVDFLKQAKDAGLEKLREYWQFGLFYMEASKG